MSRRQMAGLLALIALTGGYVWFQAGRPASVAVVRAADPATDPAPDAPIDLARARELLLRQRQG